MGLFDRLRGLLGGGAAADDSSASEREPGTSDDDGVTDDACVGDLVGGDPDGFREEAREFVEFWGEYDLDYSPASLSRLDDYARSQGERANFIAVERDDGSEVVFAPLAATAATYFGEVLVREYDGTWERADGRWGVALDGPDASLTVNAFHVAHDCFREEPKFALVHDTATAKAGVDAPRVAD